MISEHMVVIGQDLHMVEGFVLVKTRSVIKEPLKPFLNKLWSLSFRYCYLAK